MTLNELKYIVAVAREHHFGQAAKACFVSQPTLSVAVKKLEEELGVSIFERGQGDVSVTAIGEQIVAQAQRVLEEADGVKQLALQGKNQLTGPLRLGAIYTIGPYLFPSLIPLLAETAPEMPLIIEENYTSVLTEKLKQGELDAIIISKPFTEPGILTLDLYQEPFVILLPSAHPLTRYKTIKKQQLLEENILLLGAGHCFRDQVLKFCPECLPSGKTTSGVMSGNLEGSSLETIRYMVASGLGLTLLPCTAAGADRFSERLIAIRRFEREQPARFVSIAWRKSFPRPEVITALKSAILGCKLSCVSPISVTNT
ncbi:MAG: hydrogen peroxide-inducible genes activator [Chromatiales bacterium]|jgi:LysR family hydrogen peroxide-inducible transcriptional activator